MHVSRCGAQVVVWAPAKLNLFLEVLERREDGYHEIETLMTAVGLFDTLYFDADAVGEIRFSARWSAGQRGRFGSERMSVPGGDDGLPRGRENIVMRAVELMRRRACITAGARVHLIKRIPIAAGLGGGSSDAAAALVAANVGWGLGWSGVELAELGKQLGSDVPFFLSGGMAICRGRGEQVVRIAGLGRLDFVVVKPPAGLSTSAVFARCRPAGERRHVEPLVVARRSRGRAGLGHCLWNRLQEAASQLCPSVSQLDRQLGRLECRGHQMSGSGSSHFGLCRHARHARRLAGILRARRLGRVHCVASCAMS